MPEFKFPSSSSPPSTPDRNGGKYSGASQPSTTPAGPPPSSAGSFTPAGPPPSSILESFSYGSSQGSEPLPPIRLSKETVLKPPKPPFQFHGPMSSPSAAPYFRSSRAPQRSGLNNEYKAPQATLESIDVSIGLEGVNNREEGMDNESDEFEEGSYINDSESHRAEFTCSDDCVDDRQFHGSDLSSRLDFNDFNTSQQSNSSRRYENASRDSLGSTTRPFSQKPSREFHLQEVANDFYKQVGTPKVRASDYDIVLSTEELVIRLYDAGTKDEDHFSRIHSTISSDLLDLWAGHANNISAQITEEYTATMGPGPRAPSFIKANFLAQLLLILYQPHSYHGANKSSTFFTSNLLQSFTSSTFAGKAKKIPLLLSEWMHEYHNSYKSQLDEILKHKPSPADHHLFWNTVTNNLLRGQIVYVINILKTAGWRHARNPSNISEDAGYTGVPLRNIEKVIGDAIQVLLQCPFLKGDWDILDDDWTLFRVKIRKAKDSLRAFNEGLALTRHNSRETESFGRASISAEGSYSGIARKAESRIPWDIYQNLLNMYNIVLGELDPIIGSSQDWCEATIGLVIWWNPSNDRRQLTTMRSRSKIVTGSEIYLRKIADSYRLATGETTDLAAVNTLDIVEVGLACIFDGDVESVISILSSLSGTISTAIVEIASLGGWLPQKEIRALDPMDDLDQDDLDLLGITSRPENTDSLKDHVLIAYAASLAQCTQLESQQRVDGQKVNRYGWELAIEVLGRLDSVKRSEEEVGNLLHNLPLDSGVIVDKLWRLLNELGLTANAEFVAEEYARSLGESTYKYGEAIWYYALAHKRNKVKDVLDLLISFSLIYSVAYPPEHELDSHLKRLISSPKSALMEMSKLDYNAARLLQHMLSGYATLRKFYNIRDEEVQLPTTQRPKTSGFARRSDAASALVAVIASSDDNIRGGLYDENRGAVVSVDFILALLGEAMIFVDQPNSVIGPSHIDILLKTIEDLQTVPQHIYSACSEFFETVLTSGQGLKGSSPLDLLKKSTSSLSGTSSFSLAGSSMIASQLQRSMSSSGILVKENIKRGWDWRRALPANIKGEEIIRILRLGLAKEAARVWLLEADMQL